MFFFIAGVFSLPLLRAHYSRSIIPHIIVIAMLNETKSEWCEIETLKRINHIVHTINTMLYGTALHSTTCTSQKYKQQWWNFKSGKQKNKKKGISHLTVLNLGEKNEVSRFIKIINDWCAFHFERTMTDSSSRWAQYFKIDAHLLYLFHLFIIFR